jgi:CRP-like cAMP-binding protein
MMTSASTVTTAATARSSRSSSDTGVTFEEPLATNTDSMTDSESILRKGGINSDPKRPAFQRQATKRSLGGDGGPSAVFSSIRTTSDRMKVQEENHRTKILFPWSKSYSAWWAFTVFASVFTIFFETYEIAFGTAGLFPYNDTSSITEYVLVSVYVVDIVANFNLAFYNERNEIVCDRRLIAKEYMRFMLWIDLIGILPFYAFALACLGVLGQDNTLTQYLALFRLCKMVRLHRVKKVFDILQYSTKISLMTLTLTRNFAVALVWTHFSACIMYFLSRQHSFDEESTWLGVGVGMVGGGGAVENLSGYERYVTTLYWSVVTFTTVGYGDFSPVNSAEQIWGMIYMLLNIILHSWIIGSITLLIVKHDEKTGEYRNRLQVLDQYSRMHSLGRPLQKRLKTQLKLDFNNSEIADEQVLRNFPSSVRRRVLRRLYLPSLLRTSLMNGLRQQFVDAFLSACNVEFFSPGEEILQRGYVSPDLYLLVGGVVELLPMDNSITPDTHLAHINVGANGTSIADSEFRPENGMSERQIDAGDFINEIGFFTESPQIDTIRTVTVCKIMVMSRAAYTMIGQDHPGSIGKILQNLLEKVEEMAEEIDSESHVNLPIRLEVLRAGSVYDVNDTTSSHADEVHRTVASVQTQAALTAVEDLVKMHINKQKDDHTTRFLFAASRGDTSTIALMCDQGFDPNSADYDCRTALMVAAMKGNADAVTTILEYQANPNQIDVHGSSALFEAAKNGHEKTIDVLLRHGAKLCMDESLAASTLCQAVSDGDILKLRRLLRAQIQVNASDYDKRTAAHVAAAEGNVIAFKALVEFGADLTVKDRWDNTVQNEAMKAHSPQLLKFLLKLKADTTT